MRTLIVIPAFNEGQNLRRLLPELLRFVAPADVVVVDDASLDETSEVAQASGVRCLRLPVNLGIGGAVQAGFRLAVREGYDAAVQLDGDGQHPPAELQRLLAPLEADETDVVLGSRFCGRGQAKIPLLRKIGIRFFQLLNTLLLGVRVSDSTCGYRAYNRRAIELLSRVYPQDYPEPEAIVLLARNGFRMQEAAIEVHERISGRSSISNLNGVFYMLKVTVAILITMLRRRETLDGNDPDPGHYY